MQPQEKFSILLVDDDPTVIRVMGRILAQFTPLRFATSGRAAIKLARESVPDLILLDVEMPELSGFEVCRLFKSTPELADVPIILVTSHESAQLQAKGIALGAADFIEKPVLAPLLLARVRTFQRLKTLSDTMRGAVKLDFLTGASTRREFEKVATQEWLRAVGSGAALALLLADIDGFGAYNAQFGEEIADTCLRRVAGALSSAMYGSPGVLGRYAGGQFGMLLPETDVAGARIVAQRAIEAVHALQIMHAVSCAESRVSIFVGGGYLDSSRRPSSNGVAEAIPDDLRLAAERALGIARSARDDEARFVDAVRLDGPQAAIQPVAQTGTVKR